MIFNELGGRELTVLKCNNCEARFTVNKAAKLGDYCCPCCGVHYYVVVDKEAATILKAALAVPELPPNIVVQQLPDPKESTSKNKNTE